MKKLIAFLGLSIALCTNAMRPSTEVSKEDFVRLAIALTTGNLQKLDQFCMANKDRTIDGNPLLSFAIRFPSVDMARLALKYGAAVNVVEARTKMPLLHCAILANCSSEMLSLLLNAGANVYAKDGGNNIPLVIAELVHNESAISLLREAMAERPRPPISGVPSNLVDIQKAMLGFFVGYRNDIAAVTKFKEGFEQDDVNRWLALATKYNRVFDLLRILVNKNTLGICVTGDKKKYELKRPVYEEDACLYIASLYSIMELMFGQDWNRSYLSALEKFNHPDSEIKCEFLFYDGITRSGTVFDKVYGSMIHLVSDMFAHYPGEKFCFGKFYFFLESWCGLSRMILNETCEYRTSLKFGRRMDGDGTICDYFMKFDERTMCFLVMLGELGLDSSKLLKDRIAIPKLVHYYDQDGPFLVHQYAVNYRPSIVNSLHEAYIFATYIRNMPPVLDNSVFTGFFHLLKQFIWYFNNSSVFKRGQSAISDGL